MPPTSIAHYNIGEKIGSGGMGEVYRARDTKLNRDVAIKLLPEDVSRDRDRMARFEREAQVLASLNHPNIASIYGIEEQDEVRALVLELVDGETLADRIARGPLPLDEALDIARQIAEGLEAAHEVGIIHRDLKPANVIVNEDGRVKVLDFGLAKALEGASDDEDAETSPTLSFAATRAGVILGTAGYMSPEQARGHRADRRSDIWAFGVVLYEMLSGQRLFTGDTPSDVLAKVLTLEPSFEDLQVPVSIRRLLRRSLTRERKRRLQAIGEARIAIEDCVTASESVDEVSVRTSKLPWALSAALAMALVASFWLASEPSSPEVAPMRLSTELDSGGTPLFELTAVDGAATVLSPDGSTLAFVGRAADGKRQIFVRPLDRLDATPLAGTEGAYSPFFSPDGRWIAFFAGNALKRVALAGGGALTVADIVDARGGSWGEDGTIVFTPSFTAGLFRVPASGGNPTELTTLGEGERSHRWPWFLPDSEAVLFVSQAIGGTYDDAQIEVVDPTSRERRVVHRAGTYPRFFASKNDGHLVFVRESTVFAMSFDSERLVATGEPSPILGGVRTLINGAGQYAFSSQGRFVYTPGSSLGSKLPIAIADRNGFTEELAVAPGNYGGARLSPDGNQLALSVHESTGTNVYILDIERGTMAPLTFGESRNDNPVWTPDGEWIIFSSDEYGGSVPNLYRTRSDGAVRPERLTTSLHPQVPYSIAPNGQTLVFLERVPDNGNDLRLLSIEGTDETSAFLATPDNETDAAFSPDGRWIAYASDESGTYQIYVEPFPGPAGKYKVSGQEGRSPRWTRGGREIVYVERGRWMAVSVSVEGDAIRTGSPEILFAGSFGGFGPWGYYDVTSDGERFIVFPRPAKNAEITHVTILSDFRSELVRVTGR